MGDTAAIDVQPDISDSIEESSFTAATAWHSLEHVVDTLGDLRKLRVRMTSGGKLLVAVQNNGSLQWPRLSTAIRYIWTCPDTYTTSTNDRYRTC